MVVLVEDPNVSVESGAVRIEVESVLFEFDTSELCSVAVAELSEPVPHSRVKLGFGKGLEVVLALSDSVQAKILAASLVC